MVRMNAKVAYVYMRKKIRYWRRDESESAGPLYIATRQRKNLYIYMLLSETTDVHVLPVQ